MGLEDLARIKESHAALELFAFLSSRADSIPARMFQLTQLDPTRRLGENRIIAAIKQLATMEIKIELPNVKLGVIEADGVHTAPADESLAS